MEFEGHKRALTFLLVTDMIIKTFISDRNKSIAKWMRVECPKKCKALGKPIIHHFFDIWHIAKSKFFQLGMFYCKIATTFTTTLRQKNKYLDYIQNFLYGGISKRRC